MWMGEARHGSTDGDLPVRPRWDGALNPYGARRLPARSARHSHLDSDR